MLRIVAIAAAAVIPAAAIAFAQDKAAAPEKGCDGSTYEMVECLKGLTANWDKKLNTAYAAVLKAAQPKQRDQLRAAQRLWVQYRDANCLYWRLGEGTIAAIEAADCMYRLTRTRAEELDGAAERN
jgi:uncharacterized protein YecT (DUF1311 family)